MDENPITKALKKYGPEPVGGYSGQQITSALEEAGYPQKNPWVAPNVNAGQPISNYPNVGFKFGVPMTPADSDKAFANLAAIQTPAVRAQGSGSYGYGGTSGTQPQAPSGTGNYGYGGATAPENPVAAALRQQGPEPAKGYSGQQITSALEAAGYPQGQSWVGANVNGGQPISNYPNVGFKFGVPMNPADVDLAFANLAAIQTPAVRAQAPGAVGHYGYGTAGGTK